MCYILTDGSNYVSQVKTGVTVVGNVSKAQKYSTIEKARHTLKSLPKLLRRFDFKPEEYVETNDSEKISRDKIFQKMQEDDEKYDNLMTNVFQRMYEFEQYVKQLQEYDKYIDVQLEILKRALRDAEHKFEIDNIDMYTSWLIGKDVKKITQRRRKLKDDKEIIKYIMEQNIVGCNYNLISNFIKNKEYEDPTYKARYLEYLFNE
jgi:hypothetical protein